MGLLEEGRFYMRSEAGQENNCMNQHTFVKNVLQELMTPILPPFYRLFMAGMIPSKEKNDPEFLVNLTNNLLNLIPDEWTTLKRKLQPGRKPFGKLIYF